MAILPIVGPAYESKSKEQSTQQCINWYLDRGPDGIPIALMPTPGMTSFSSIGGGSDTVRALHTHKGILYAVVTNTFYSIDSAGAATNRGSLNTVSGRVVIASIDDELVMVDGLNGYSYVPSTTTFSTIVDSDFPDTTETITAQDGYFITPKVNSGQFIISNLNDGLTWDTLDFATAEGVPDNLQTAFSDNRQLWLFGDRTTEVWYNAGTSFPFQRYQDTFIDIGTPAKHSIAKLDNTLFWLGQDRGGNLNVIKANGFTPQIVTTPAIAYQFGTYSTISDAFAISYAQEGHLFYCLTFPTEGVTWVYDALTNAWHERASDDNDTQTRWRANCYAHCYNKHLVGDFTNGDILELDVDTYTENGNTITRTRTTTHVEVENRIFSVYNLVIDFERGVGLSTGQGSDPKYMLSVSKDGGNTYGNEMWRSPGKIGVFDERAVWTRLGRGRSMTFKLKITDPVKAIVLDASANIEVGAA